MDEYVTKEQVIDWYRPYGQTDDPIPFETLVSDLRDMKAADVVPVRHGRWIETGRGLLGAASYKCSECEQPMPFYNGYKYCPNCGAKMDLEG